MQAKGVRESPKTGCTGHAALQSQGRERQVPAGHLARSTASSSRPQGGARASLGDTENGQDRAAGQLDSRRAGHCGRGVREGAALGRWPREGQGRTEPLAGVSGRKMKTTDRQGGEMLQALGRRRRPPRLGSTAGALAGGPGGQRAALGGLGVLERAGWGTGEGPGGVARFRRCKE